MKKERGNCGMWGGGGVDGDREYYVRTKNEKRNNSRNLERKERERGVGGGWRKMIGNAVKELYSQNSCAVPLIS